MLRACRQATVQRSNRTPTPSGAATPESIDPVKGFEERPWELRPRSLGRSAVSEVARERCSGPRGDSVAASMSQYLITEIDRARNISVGLQAEVISGSGHGRLESVTLRTTGGVDEVVPASTLFLLIGAERQTGWLGSTVARDERGFILTGPKCSIKPEAAAAGEGATSIQLVHEHLRDLTQATQHYR